MGLEIMPNEGEAVERRFIRFLAKRIPFGVRGGQHGWGHDGEWFFRADLKLDGRRHFIEWYQPSQEGEPEPDSERFLKAVWHLLMAASDGKFTPPKPGPQGRDLPCYLARRTAKEGGRLIGEFSSFRALDLWCTKQGCPSSWVEIGIWNGQCWDWHNFGELVKR